jgi:hypothetical protein
MAERLRLTRTFGIAGWQTWNADGDSFVLAALGTCLLRPGTALELRGLWQLARRWHAGFATLDANALGLALCVRSGVKLADVNVRVGVALPSRETPAPKQFRFVLRTLRRAARLPGSPAGRAWIVLRLAEGSERMLARMTAALAAAPKGAQLQIEIKAQRVLAPDTLRTSFPLRVEGQFDAGEGWFPLISDSQIDTTRPPIA